MLGFDTTDLFVIGTDAAASAAAAVIQAKITEATTTAGVPAAAVIFKAAADIAQTCDTTQGRYGLVVGSIKLCPLCNAGSYGDGKGCTACEAGRASGNVGALANACTGANGRW